VAGSVRAHASFLWLDWLFGPIILSAAHRSSQELAGTFLAGCRYSTGWLDPESSLVLVGVGFLDPKSPLVLVGVDWFDPGKSSCAF